jgi:hypothetical protein
MTQHCDVYINILCDENDKINISEWLREYFNDDNNMKINGIPLDYLEIVDDAKGLIVLDLEVDVPVNIEKYHNPDYVAIHNDYFNDLTFVDWIEDILPDSFEFEIEIDKDSKIPTEEQLYEKYLEENEDYMYMMHNL